MLLRVAAACDDEKKYSRRTVSIKMVFERKTVKQAHETLDSHTGHWNHTWGHERTLKVPLLSLDYIFMNMHTKAFLEGVLQGKNATAFRSGARRSR